MGDLCRRCRKVDLGHHSVMIYINLVELLCLMSHVMFQNNRLSSSGQEDFFQRFLLFISMAVILVMWPRPLI